MDIAQAQLKAKEQCGVLLPGVDPSIGEIVLSAFFANEKADVGSVMAALVKQAPDPIAHEVVAACLELLLCRERGALAWLDVDAQAILVGIRQLANSQGMCFGTEAHWPMKALMVGPPKSAVIRMPNGVRRVWMACEGLDGAVIRQSEAIALGNAMVEAFGGRIIEDRVGPETMKQSFIEGNMTKRAKLRAQATQAAERMVVEKGAEEVRVGHNRVAMAEALPGSCEPGMVFHPEDLTGPLYQVERRVNESWVVLVAQEAGAAGNVYEACGWYSGDGVGPFGPEAPPDWGFTEGPIVAEVKDDGQAGAGGPDAPIGSRVRLPGGEEAPVPDGAGGQG